jgi:RHS repeat-associated protein
VPSSSPRSPAPRIATISITAPTNGAVLSKIEYFEGANSVGISSIASYAWTPLLPGTYTLSAKVTDSKGATGVSTPVTITVANTSGETITFLHNDFAGSAIASTDAAGVLLWKENYTPFGDRAVKAANATGNRQWYTGKPVDSETGLSNFGARMYDPVVGRFMGIDAVGFSEGNLHSFNRYAYGNNNPYKFVDPDGRDAVVINGQIKINPAATGVPSVTIPNNVGAKGVAGSDRWFHKYSYDTPSNLTLSQVGSGMANNPTPGDDSPASAPGTTNDVGWVSIIPSPNLVKSFVVDSPDKNKYSDITINYTISGKHTLDEGFVMRHGEKNAKGGTDLRTYGEGNAFKQDNSYAKSKVGGVWSAVDKEIIRDAK